MARKTVEVHEESFIHISKQGIGRFFLFLLALAATVGHTTLINAIYKAMVGDGGFKAHHLVIIYPCIIQLGLVCFTVWALLALCYKGYKNLGEDHFCGMVISLLPLIILSIFGIGIVFIEEGSFLSGLITITSIASIAIFVGAVIGEECS